MRLPVYIAVWLQYVCELVYGSCRKLKKARLSYQRVGFDTSDDDDEPVSL